MDAGLPARTGSPVRNTGATEKGFLVEKQVLNPLRDVKERLEAATDDRERLGFDDLLGLQAWLEEFLEPFRAYMEPDGPGACFPKGAAITSTDRTGEAWDINYDSLSSGDLISCAMHYIDPTGIDQLYEKHRGLYAAVGLVTRPRISGWFLVHFKAEEELPYSSSQVRELRRRFRAADEAVAREWPAE